MKSKLRIVGQESKRRLKQSSNYTYVYQQLNFWVPPQLTLALYRQSNTPEQLDGANLVAETV